MISTSSTLEGKDFRRRIDGMNFTLIIPHLRLSEISNESVLENEKNAEISFSLARLAKVFDFEIGRVSILRFRAVIDLTKKLGVYIEVFFRRYDLFILLQLKGYFFINEHAYEMARGLIRRTSEEFKELFRVTLVDVAQDFLVPVDCILPDPANPSPEIKYCFKHTSRNNFAKEGDDSVFTGFELFAGRFKLIVYDKVFENKDVKNVSKRAYYESLFEKYPGIPVSRVELRLKQEACKSLYEAFYDPTCTEEDFITLCFKSLYRKHKLRFRKPDSLDTDWRRWPVHPNWKYLFERNTSLSSLGTTQANFLFTSPHKTINEAISKLIEAMSLSCPNYTQEEFLNALKGMDIEKFREKARQKLEQRQKTQDFLAGLKEQYLPPKGQNLGMFITSPTKSNDPHVPGGNNEL